MRDRWFYAYTLMGVAAVLTCLAMYQLFDARVVLYKQRFLSQQVRLSALEDHAKRLGDRLADHLYPPQDSNE